MVAALATLVLLLGVDPLTVTLKKSNDSAVISFEGKRADVAIQSPTGIGSATLRPSADGWPESLRLNLQLKGLEGITLQGERVRIRSFLGSREPDAQLLRDGKWIAADDAKVLVPKIRRDGATIVVEISAAMLDAAGKELRVDWVDFYRG